MIMMDKLSKIVLTSSVMAYSFTLGYYYEFLKNIRDNDRNAITTPISESSESSKSKLDNLDNLDRDIDYLKTLEERPFSRRMLIPDPTSSGFKLIPAFKGENSIDVPLYIKMCDEDSYRFLTV